MKSLVVDDELVSRKKMIKILALFGSCDSVKNGKAALSVVKTTMEKNQTYDLITLDVSMPDINGTKVLDKIREMESDKGILKENRTKVLMVTSHSDVTTVKACLGKCDGYVVKPFDKPLMVEKMTKINLIE